MDNVIMAISKAEMVNEADDIEALAVPQGILMVCNIGVQFCRGFKYYATLVCIILSLREIHCGQSMFLTHLRRTCLDRAIYLKR